MSVNEGKVIDIHAVINILFDQATSRDPDEPVISLTGITAAYTQSGAVYPDTPLNDLKNDLIVTAVYSDESTETLQASDYTLTGTLTVGTSVITAAYQGKTDTFNVTVTARPVISLTSITAVYTQSGSVYPDTPLNDLKDDLIVTAIYSDESTEVLQASDYTLTGTLTVGTSVITAAYQGKTVTFNVTVSQHSGGTSDMNGWTDGVAYTNLTIINNEYVDKTDGSFDSYNGWSRTGFVPCNECSTLLFNQNSRESSYNAFYDSDKNFIRSFSLAYSADISVTVPSNAYYYVLSNVTANLNGCINNGITPNA